MTKKARPNEPCRCGSGRKFKKCCGAPGARSGAGGLPHTQADRVSAFEKLDFFIEELWGEEEESAFEEFWGRHPDREDELPPELLVMSRDVQEAWFAFDCQLEDGRRILDEFLEQAVLSSGERSSLTAMRQSTMRLYEVTESVPGASMTHRDLVEGTVVAVSERTASRTLSLRALDGARCEGLTRAGDRAWSWSRDNGSSGETSLSSLEVRGGMLTVEANSVERGARAREIVERLAGAATRHRAITHEDLRRMYERALKDGQPAYDPSWTWAERGLEPAADLSQCPPLAHERVAERVPGSGDASRAAAERFRAMPSFSDTSTTLEDDELARDLQLQRFVRRERASANDAAQEGALAAPYLPLMVNLDLHRRKVFWVDASLSYMLENTDVDVTGRELRAPFPSFAIAFTDRHALSLGERLLARAPDDPLRGRILRVATVYVTERHRGGGRVLSIVFAFDALGVDLPSLVRYEVPADHERSVRAFLESVAPRSVAEAEVRDSSPARGLLRVVLNAILYATSAGVTPEVRKA
jgi:SEC-C motif